MERLYNWGMYPSIEAEVLSTNNYAAIEDLVADTNAFIPRGNGRCYGDSALQKTVFSTLSLNKIIHFDKEIGTITCEAGVLLSDILEVIVPEGYFLPVTPGTKWVTLGGAIASNVHGKNHHKEGALACYVESLQLYVGEGMILECSRTENATFFSTTIGGMGLTGIILSATIRLKKIETSYIVQKTLKAKHLAQLLDWFQIYNDYTYSVAWIDCLVQGASLGQSLLMLGEHATKKELISSQGDNPLRLHSRKQINIPITLPSFLLNQVSVKAFNYLYYHKQRKREADSIVHYDTFFYPLDVLNHWNRIYGKKGFTQYQFVLPFEKGEEGLRKILDKIANAGCASFLAVLKTFGDTQNDVSPISFPMPGFTLALDFKINNKVLLLLKELDAIVLDYGGRLYLTKDARMSQEVFQTMYPVVVRHSDRFRSMQSDRLML